MTNELRIVSHVPVPTTAKERENNKIFNAYKHAYKAVYGRVPILHRVTESGYFVIDTLQLSVKAKRLKQLTSMLREKAKAEQ